MGKTKKTAAVVTIILAVIFFIVSAVFIGQVADHNEKLYIIENGTEAYAFVYKIDSNTTVNDEPLYRLYYYYDNAAAGVYIEGQTGDKYSMWELQTKFNFRETPLDINKFYIDDIKIFYLDDGRSVEADYAESNDAGLFTALIFVFGGLGIFMIALAVVNLVQFKKAKAILTNGHDSTAAFIAMKGGIIVNGVQQFSIVYSWQDDNGNLVETKSPTEYTYYEAMLFQNAKTFNIKTMNGKSVISGKPAPVFTSSESTVSSAPNKPTTIKCEYCGTIAPSGANKCPGCGGKIR